MGVVCLILVDVCSLKRFDYWYFVVSILDLIGIIGCSEDGNIGFFIFWYFDDLISFGWSFFIIKML